MTACDPLQTLNVLTIRLKSFICVDNLMKKLGASLILLLAGCVTAMSAQQFYAAFPQATSTRYLTGAEARASVENGACSILADHVYNAPIGYSVQGDVNAGAEGVDGIVANEGGNAYRITNFGWLPVADGSGATQLRVEFETLSCN